MIRPTEDRLFDRYRRSGDARLLGRVFDRTAPELSRIATWLCGRADDAEDVLQSTFLTAIEDAHRWDPVRRLRPWLIGILVNHVRRVRRQRRGHEPLAADPPTAASGPHAQAADRELALLVHATVARLPEPYRAAVTDCLLGGARPGAVAAATGVRPGTLRMRLQRGLDRLRQLLPHGAALPAVAALGADRLRAVRSVVLDTALAKGHAGVSGAAALVGSGTWLGVLVMQRLVAVALALVVLAALPLAWFLLVRTPGTVPESATLALMPPPATSRAAAITDAPRDPPTTREAATPRASVPRALGRARVLVRNALTKVPLAGVEVLGRVVGPATDARGQCLLDLPAGQHRVQARLPGREPITSDQFAVAAGATTDLTIDVPSLFVVEITVVDGSGKPVPDVAVWGEVEGLAHLRWGAIGTTNAAGVLQHAPIRPREVVFAVARGFLPSASRSLAATAGERQSLQLVVDQPGVHLRGLVQDERGTGVPDALVAVQGPGANRPPLPLFLRSDAQGHFESWSAPRARSPVFATTRQPGDPLYTAQRLGRAEFDPDQPDAIVRIELGRTATVRGRVPTAPGGVRPAAVGAQFAEAGIEGNLANELSRVVSAGAGEEFVLAGLVPGHYLLECRRGGDVQRREVDLIAGQSLDWHPESRALQPLLVLVRDERGNPRSGHKVSVRAASDPGAQEFRAITDEQGRAAFADLSEAEQRVAVFAPGIPWPLLESTVPTGQREYTLRLTPEIEPSVRVHGRLVLPSGDAVDRYRARVIPLRKGVMSLDGPTLPLQIAADGALSCAQRLPPGEYCADVRRDDQPVGFAGPIRAAPDGVLALGEVAVLEAARVALAVHDDQGAAVPDAVLLVEVRGKLFELPAPRTDGDDRSWDLAAGSWDVLVWGPDVAPVREHVAVSAQRPTRLTVTCPRAVRCTFDLSAVPPERRTALCIVGPGVSVSERLRGGTGRFARGLRPGTYRVEVRDADDCAVAATEVVVAPGVTQCTIAPRPR